MPTLLLIPAFPMTVPLTWRCHSFFGIAGNEIPLNSILSAVNELAYLNNPAMISMAVNSFDAVSRGTDYYNLFPGFKSEIPLFIYPLLGA